MEVRDARPEDARAVEQVRVDGWRVAYLGLVARDLLADLVVEDDRVAALTAAFAGPAAHEVNLVAAQDGAVLAMARLCGCRDEDGVPEAVAELRALYVAPGSWARGLGGRLLDEGFARMPQPVQVLWTLEGNTRARRFYERRGFVLEGAGRVRNLGEAASEVRYHRRRPAAVPGEPGPRLVPSRTATSRYHGRGDRRPAQW